MAFHRDRVFWTISAQIALVNFYLGGLGVSGLNYNNFSGKIDSLMIFKLDGNFDEVELITSPFQNIRSQKFGPLLDISNFKNN